MIVRSLVALLACTLSSVVSYSFDDPTAAHTKQAIEFDSQGRRLESLRSFQAAVRFGESADTFVNLGVCLMRLGTASMNREEKVNYYHKAHAAMGKGLNQAMTEKERLHVSENQGALKQSMNAEQVPPPSEELDPMEGALGEGALGSFVGEKRKKRRKKQSYYSDDGLDDGFNEVDDSVAEVEVSSGADYGNQLATPKKMKKRRKKKPPMNEDGDSLGTLGSLSGGASAKSKASKRYNPPPPPVHRPRLEHQRSQVPLGVPMPRVTTAQLDSGLPEFAPFRDRKQPYILTDGLVGWGAMQDWPMSWRQLLPDLFPDAVTDFYPYNMLLPERQNPYLTRLPRAVEELMGVEPGPLQQKRDGSAFAYDPSAMAGRYMHLQLTPRMWSDLEARGDIRVSRHWHLSSDAWLEECLGYPASELAEEYHLKTHWKIVLAGTRGAGMFNHSDSLLTSSWHAHLMGEKWWYVCGTLSEGNKSQICYEDYLMPGETLYYGHGWSHETQNLETPTMTITDTVAHAGNFHKISDMLHATCSRDFLRFGFSAKLCDALDKCYGVLHEMHKGTEKPAHVWRPWREVATKDYIAKAEKVNPKHNNYDGRNFITEMWPTGSKPRQAPRKGNKPKNDDL